MKIANSAMDMRSAHVAITRNTQQQTLRAWVGQQRPDFEGHQAQGQPSRPSPPRELVQISAAGRSAQVAAAGAPAQADDAASLDPRLLLLKAIVEWMTGKSAKLYGAPAAQASAAPAAPLPAVPPTDAAPEAAAPTRAGFGVEYDAHVVHEEAEQTQFSAIGTIRTADGRDIAFDLSLTMSRQYREETNVSVRAGDGVRKDPLVINFGGTAAQLSSQRFKFDLDGDGTAEEVPLLGAGSGYLALDLDGNGKIDSGKELLGPADGSGFAALARYDQDGNGWIDENDRVFGKLQVWQPTADGKGTLSSLAEHKVGALYVGHVATPFELRGPDNADLGAVRASGAYLTESGEAGSLQEIDLSV